MATLTHSEVTASSKVFRVRVRSARQSRQEGRVARINKNQGMGQGPRAGRPTQRRGEWHCGDAAQGGLKQGPLWGLSSGRGHTQNEDLEK